VKRRDFLKQSLSAGILTSGFPFSLQTTAPGFQFADVTAQSGINFRHNSGAYGGKLLPETLGSGCAFLDYDATAGPTSSSSIPWTGPATSASDPPSSSTATIANGTFTDVTKSAGLDLELYGMGVAVADYDNDGFPDIFISCVGQSRLFHNNGNGSFTDVTQKSGLLNKQAFSTSAVWFDYDRDGPPRSLRLQLRSLVRRTRCLLQPRRKK